MKWRISYTVMQKNCFNSGYNTIENGKTEASFGSKSEVNNFLHNC